jgi:hypothetical protein
VNFGGARVVQPGVRGLVLFSLLLIAACGSGGATAATSTSTSSTSVAPTTGTTLVPLDPALTGPALDPAALGSLPDEGVAVGFPARNIVVLAGLDGTVLGHVDGALLAGPAGTVARSSPDGVSVLDVGAARFAPRGDITETPERLLAGDAWLAPWVQGAGWVLHGPHGPVTLPPGEPVMSDGGDVVTVLLGPELATRAATAVRVSDGSQSPRPAGCAVADTREDGAELLACTDRLVLVGAGGGQTTLAGAVGAGHWAGGSLAPAGDAALGQWSGECEVPTAYLVTAGREPLALPGTEYESGALGWPADGIPLFAVYSGVCGAPYGPGVWRSVDGGFTAVYRLPEGEAFGVALWRRR